MEKNQLFGETPDQRRNFVERVGGIQTYKAEAKHSPVEEESASGLVSGRQSCDEGES